MECSACKANMTELTLDGVVIDRCDRCAGVWLDAGEAESLVKKTPTPREALQKKKLDLLRQWKVAPVEPKQVDRPCPRCGKNFVRVNYKDIPGLQVDKCPADCGIYLDKGELEKIRLID
jgi:Zn-finger nucleic acid-binding protein